MARNDLTTRRGVLAAVTLSAGVAVLSGCGQDENCQWDDAEGETPATGTHALATLSDIAVGGMVSATAANGNPVVVTRPTEDTAVAFSAICPHKGCQVTPDGDGLRCPPHDASFDPVTGKVLDGPPKSPLRPIKVTIVDGQVVMSA